MYLNTRTIAAPRLHKLGFQSDDSESRVKQGLLPQGLASLCYIYADEEKLKVNPYFNNVVFPIRGLYVDYGMTEIPSNCPSLSNFHVP